MSQSPSPAASASAAGRHCSARCHRRGGWGGWGGQLRDSQADERPECSISDGAALTTTPKRAQASQASTEQVLPNGAVLTLKGHEEPGVSASRRGPVDTAFAVRWLQEAVENPVCTHRAPSCQLRGPGSSEHT